VAVGAALAVASCGQRAVDVTDAADEVADDAAAMGEAASDEGLPSMDAGPPDAADVSDVADEESAVVALYGAPPFPDVIFD
jgi:Ni,Fe-hydrogenase I small subunit